MRRLPPYPAHTLALTLAAALFSTPALSRPDDLLLEKGGPAERGDRGQVRGERGTAQRTDPSREPARDAPRLERPRGDAAVGPQPRPVPVPVAVPAPVRAAPMPPPMRAAPVVAEATRHDNRGHDRRDDRRDDRGADRRDDPRNDRGRDFGWDHRGARPPFHPAPGLVLRSPPSSARVVVWGGVPYHYGQGVWFTSHRQGWVVVRPPVGLVLRDLPLWRTVVVIGGLSYLLADGVYYRERRDGYEVVNPPAPLAAPVVGADSALPKQYVYPRLGQSAEHQASDEYECHRWAVDQTGFDPTDMATQAPGADWSKRDDYLRARAACLDARGYTVK